MRSNWVIGNWKMNGDLKNNEALLTAICTYAQSAALGDTVKLGVCVPFPYLAQASVALFDAPVALGAQNVSESANGAFTGEVSTSMLADFAVSLVLVGHSERRSMYGESDELVAQKAAAVIAAGLKPVVCVGESLAERESGQARAVVVRQLKKVMDVIGVSGLSSMILAYEPVWAIGTGKTASPEQAQEVHAWLREEVAQLDAVLAQEMSIVYGGSVKPANASEIFSQSDVDGGLIGGAALVAEDFLAICRSV